MPEQNSFTYKLTEAQMKRLRQTLEEKSFEFRELAHAHFGASRQKLTVNLYLTGKMLVQGKGATDFIRDTLEPEVLGEARLGYEEVWNPEMFQPHLGIDESGKGDFFGPLVIAGVFVDERTSKKLMASGVRDSKTITSDKVIREISDKIRDIVGRSGWSRIILNPTKYNELYHRFGNLNRLLAWGHASVIENLLEQNPDCPRALSDKFADDRLIQKQLKTLGKGIVLEQRTKAESDLAVAAASILAREGFIDRMKRIGEDLGVELPRGASNAVQETAKTIFKMRGATVLGDVCKSHFKTFLVAQGLPVPETKEWVRRPVKTPKSQ